MNPMAAILFSLVVSCFLIPESFATSSNQFYTAAVFEHARFGSRNDSAKTIVETNLAFYRKATLIAKSKGADIIVFPEYGIFPPGSRKKLKEYLETAPDPRLVLTNPCVETETYLQRPILHTLSCLARNNSIYVVANTGDIQNCEGDPKCPSDGVFQFNTNVVFDRDGKMLVKYHKEHLYFEMGMDLARQQQNSTFETDFGIFATYICFDIMFGRISQVAHWPNVDGIAFPTMWLDATPQLNSVQLWQSWSLGNNMTFLAANIQIPNTGSVGSGIFHGEAGALGYTFNPDGISKLVVAKVPKRNNPRPSYGASITAITATEFWDFEDDGKDVPKECMKNPSGNMNYHCFSENMENYTLARLTKPSGYLEACNNGFCCSLDYATNNLTDNFYLGVFNGTYNVFKRYFWCDQSCVLAICSGPDHKPCSVHSINSETIFQHVHLTGKFSTKSVYPSVLENKVRLTPRSEWDYTLSNDIPYEAQVRFENHRGKNLVTVGLKGRCYDRDPPYVR